MQSTILEWKVADLYNLDDVSDCKLCTLVIKEWRQRFYKIPKVITEEELLEYACATPISVLRHNFGDMPKLRVLRAGTLTYYPEKCTRVFNDFLQRLEKRGLRALDWPLIAGDLESVAFSARQRMSADREKLVGLSVMTLLPRPSVFNAFVRLFYHEKIIQRDEQILSVPISNLLTFSYTYATAFVAQNKKKYEALNLFSEIHDKLYDHGLRATQYPFLQKPDW
jgi:hypothetical protein